MADPGYRELGFTGYLNRASIAPAAINYSYFADSIPGTRQETDRKYVEMLDTIVAEGRATAEDARRELRSFARKNYSSVYRDYLQTYKQYWINKSRSARRMDMQRKLIEGRIDIQRRIFNRVRRTLQARGPYPNVSRMDNLANQISQNAIARVYTAFDVPQPQQNQDDEDDEDDEDNDDVIDNPNDPDYEEEEEEESESINEDSIEDEDLEALIRENQNQENANQEDQENQDQDQEELDQGLENENNDEDDDNDDDEDQGQVLEDGDPNSDQLLLDEDEPTRGTRRNEE